VEISNPEDVERYEEAFIKELRERGGEKKEFK